MPRKGFLPRISVLRHSCNDGSFANMLQTFMGQQPTKCAFYWKMRGGKTYTGNLHYFTAFGLRVVIDTAKKKPMVLAQPGEDLT